MNKQEIYEQSRDLMVKLYGPEILHQHGNCVFWLQCAGFILMKHGLTPYPQAGTMLWRFIRPENDDGKKATYFGYEWSPDHPLSRIAIAQNQLPEMHCWLVLPERMEILDFSTDGFKARAIKEGHPWETPDPPRFLWCNYDEIPDDAIYNPHADAIRFLIAKKMMDAA